MNIIQFLWPNWDISTVMDILIFCEEKNERVQEVITFAREKLHRKSIHGINMELKRNL